jgi:hypothetical protein
VTLPRRRQIWVEAVNASTDALPAKIKVESDRREALLLRARALETRPHRARAVLLLITHLSSSEHLATPEHSCRRPSPPARSSAEVLVLPSRAPDPCHSTRPNLSSLRSPSSPLPTHPLFFQKMEPQALLQRLPEAIQTFKVHLHLLPIFLFLAS